MKKLKLGLLLIILIFGLVSIGTEVSGTIDPGTPPNTDVPDPLPLP